MAGTIYVGGLKGDFSISSDGAAVYEIKLPLPPGTAGMAPALSLVYNSAGGNGILGMGWQLAGLSIVSRVGATVAQDTFPGAVSYDDNDRFALDGGRLVPVQGVYGDAGAIYHTEIERWSKVTPSYGNTPGRNGPDSFTVTTRTGVVQEFGTTPDSQVAASSGNPSVRVWALNRTTDRNGNFMTVTYNTADGAFAPARIDYTGNGDIAPQRSVQFTYEDRPDPFTRYVGGYPVVTTQRLKKIDVFVAQTKVMTYSFAYQAGTGTGRSQLHSVTQSDGTGNALSPTVFTWQQGAPRPLSSTPVVTPTSAIYGGNFIPFDIDGGGRFGFLNAHGDPASGNLVVDLYPAGATSPVATPVAQMGLPFGSPLFPIDVNGNGCTDLVVATNDSSNNLALTIFMATATNGSWNLQAGAIGGALPNSQLPWGGSLYPADVNGDGKTDFIYVNQVNPTNTAQFTVLLSDGTGYAQAGVTTTSLPYGGTCIALDVNGDGRTDIAYAYMDPQTELMQIAVLLSNGTSLSVQNPAILPTELPFSGALMPLDVNGDGLVDLVLAALAADGASLALTTLINTGAGFTAQPSQTFPVPFGAVLAPGDVNGDGLTDMVAALVGADGSTQLQILQSTGSGFTLAPQPPSVPNTASAPLLPIDLAGVGMTGLVILTQATDGTLVLQSIAPAGAFPDLMTGVATGLGGQYAITYKPLTDPSVYTHTAPTLNPTGALAGGSQGATYAPSASGLQGGTAAAIAPARIVTIPKYVAASYVKRDGQGGNYGHSYSYSNAMIDTAGGRGWLGFANQTFSDDDLGTLSSSNFAQDFPLTGTVTSHSISRASDKALMFQATLTPKVLTPYPNVSQVVIVQNQTRLYTFGRLDTTRVINTEPDACGNPAFVSDLGDETGAALYTTNTFNNDTVNWTIGQPTGSTQAADSAGTQILSKSRKSYYPATGNLKQDSVWHDQTATWLATDYKYDGFGNRKRQAESSAGASAAVTDYSYDSAFNTFVTSVTRPATDAGLRMTTQYQYEPVFGALLQITDPNGVVTAQQIDGLGRLIQKSAIDPHNNVVPVTKVALLQDATSIYRETQAAVDWAGTIWTWQHEYLDGLGRVYRTVKVGADGTTPVIVERTLNSKSQPTSESLPYFQGVTPVLMTTAYDAFSRPSRSTKPADGGATSVTTFEYPNVFTTVQTEAAGTTAARATTTVYGTFNGKALARTSTDATGAATALHYDALGRMTAAIDAIGTQTSLTYDSLGQKTGFTTQSNGTVLRQQTSQYDLVARVASSTDSRGQTVTQTRDALGRVITKTDNTGNRTVFTYDTAASFGLGRLASLTMPDGNSYAFAYDAGGNETSIMVTAGGRSHTFVRSFLPFRRPQQEIFPDGAVQTNTFTRGGSLDSITIAEGGATVASVSLENYNAFGKPGTMVNGNGVTETLTYNAAGQLHGQTVQAPAGPLSQNTFAWNLLDDLHSITDGIDPTRNYAFEYDRAGRLKQADGPFATPQAFNYDAAGNLHEKAGETFQYQNGMLVAAGAATIQHDAWGNIKTVTANGTTTDFFYDANGRLERAANSTFSYDYSGRRLSKSTPGGATTYYVAPNYEVTELPGGGIQHTKYLRSPLGLGAAITTGDQAGPAGSAPPAGVPAPGVCYFHRNQVNSTTLVTDAAGALAARVAYLPFGEIASLTGSDTFRAKFAGRELDQETGLSYFGARYYSAEFGRFITPDDRLGGPLGYRDICNTYAYVLNSPVCHVDPTGHSFFSDIGSAFSDVGKALVSGPISLGEELVNTRKQWAPWVVDGLLIIAGAVVLATVPFGGPASAIIGGALLGAGISGLTYNIETAAAHEDTNWNHWGVQLGIGAATGAFGGAVGEVATAAADSLELAVGSASRMLLMGAAGAVIGAGGNAFTTYIDNIDYHRSGGEGVGWAAVVGAGTGFLGGANAERLAGKDSFSIEVEEDASSRNFMNSLEVKMKRKLDDTWWKTAILKGSPKVFTSGGSVLLYFGPQWTW
jgi:RHS repeat-associated protein